MLRRFRQGRPPTTTQTFQESHQNWRRSGRRRRASPPRRTFPFVRERWSMTRKARWTGRYIRRRWRNDWSFSSRNSRCSADSSRSRRFVSALFVAKTCNTHHVNGISQCFATFFIRIWNFGTLERLNCSRNLMQRLESLFYSKWAETSFCCTQLCTHEKRLVHLCV